MAWTYEQDFEGLNTGDLNGQDSWSGGTGFDVQSSVVYEGSQAVSVDDLSSDQSINRSISDPGDFTQFIAMRTSGSGNVIWKMFESSTEVLSCRFSTGGDIQIFDYSDTWVTIISFSSDTWYVIEIEADFTAGTYRARAHNGSTWSSYTSELDMNGTPSGVDEIQMRVVGGNAGDTAYYDIITATDPTVADTFTPKVIGPF